MIIGKGFLIKTFARSTRDSPWRLSRLAAASEGLSGGQFPNDTFSLSSSSSLALSMMEEKVELSIELLDGIDDEALSRRMM